MIKYFICFVALFTIGVAQAQNTIKIAVKNGENKEAVIGASAKIENTAFTALAGADGILTFENVPNGDYTLIISAEDFGTRKEAIKVPFTISVLEITLESSAEEMEEIVVNAMRGTRTISNIPTRVEFIAGEELEEKANMKPGDIRMMLNESTGIQTQQTSATSGNSSIRIQGLDGRYTQILKIKEETAV